MRATAAEIILQLGFDLLLGWVRVAPQQRGGLHDHAVDAVPALYRLLLDEGLLYRMRMAVGAEALERDDVAGVDRGERYDARPHRLAIHENRAGSALTQAAAKART